MKQIIEGMWNASPSAVINTTNDVVSQVIMAYAIAGVVSLVIMFVLWKLATRGFRDF